jgi:hypothetical protein
LERGRVLHYIGWSYADDGAGDRLPLADYQALLTDALARCYRVLRAGGVLALNLPPSINVAGEHRAWPVAAWAQMHPKRPAGCSMRPSTG